MRNAPNSEAPKLAPQRRKEKERSFVVKSPSSLPRFLKTSPIARKSENNWGLNRLEKFSAVHFLIVLHQKDLI
jgi:hypothetical protein